MMGYNYQHYKLWLKLILLRVLNRHLQRQLALSRAKKEWKADVLGHYYIMVHLSKLKDKATEWEWSFMDSNLQVVIIEQRSDMDNSTSECCISCMPSFELGWTSYHWRCHILH